MSQTPVDQLPLDPSLYTPLEEEVAFFKSQTGIQDDDELKRHILVVQKEAWDVFKYLCIRMFAFMLLGISRHPKYSEFLKLRDEKPGAIYLELACFFGTDIRRAIADGYPTENIVASDLEPAFWDLGHKLFKTTPETFPVPFVQADALDPTHIVPSEPFYDPPTHPRPDLKTLTSLTPLQGHVSAIHVGSFFHLFDEETQLRAARALATLLSPERGSMIFGHNLGTPNGGPRDYVNQRGQKLYRHSPGSWCELWDGTVFKRGTVDVWVHIEEFSKDVLAKSGNDVMRHIMIWSVVRKC